MYKKILFGFVSLVLLSQQQNVVGFAIVSHVDSILAYGSALDDDVGQVITAGIDSRRNADTTNCYTSIGSVNGFARHIQESPPLCLDIKLFDKTFSSSLPDGVVSAMDGQQPLLLASRRDYKSSMTPNVVLAKDSLPQGYFPATIITDDRDGVYVALHPTNGLIRKDLSYNHVQATWDYLQQLTHPINQKDESNSYSPIILKYNMLDTSNDDSRPAKWQTPFTTTQGKTMIAAMATSRDALVVVGSSTGYGISTGAEGYSGGYWDGFITLVDKETGEIDDQNFGTYSSHSTRIRSQWNKNDWVLGLCMDEDKAYVVGSTTGKIEGKEAGGGFVMKMDIDTLDIIWKKQIVGEGIEVTHCDVRGNTLYVGGTVPDGINLDDTKSSSSGTNDILVALFDAKTGESTFVRQVDSHDRDDQLVGMEINQSGDVYITANAWDFDKRMTHLYILSVTSKGEYDWQNLPEGDDPISGPTQDPNDPSVNNRPLDDYNFRPTKPGKTLKSDNNATIKSDNIIAAIVTPIVCFVAFLVGFLLVYYKKYLCFKSKEKDPVIKPATHDDDSQSLEKHSSEAQLV